MQNTRLVGYIAAIGAAGLSAVAASFVNWQCQDKTAFAGYLGLSLVASAIKLRLPGFTTTVSLGFVTVLVGVALMSQAETVIAACAAALVQTVWSSRKGWKPLQAVFNIGLLASSSWVAHLLAHAAPTSNAAVTAAIAVAPLYLLNAFALALVLVLSSEGALRDIWRRFQLWVFPYYLVGALLASLISFTGRVDPSTPLLWLLGGIAYLSFSSYRSWAERGMAVPQAAS